MARSRREILRQIQSLEPGIMKAFIDAIRDIQSEVEITRITGFIQSGDIASAIAAMQLDESVFRDLDLAITAAFIAGGKAELDSLPALRQANGTKTIIRFGIRNPRAEQWLRQHSAGYVTRIVQRQREAIQGALVEALSQGRNPRNTALDIVGRINRATGRREGGIVGLTGQQSQFVLNARNQLSSGDPALMRDYFNRKLRDRRFDGIVRRAIENNRAVNQTDIDKMLARYSDRLLRSRGETIARTESLTSLNAAADEAYRQAIDTGALQSQHVTRTWDSAGDGRVRDTHAEMDGDKRDIDTPFVSPSGALLRYPGDPDAPPEERIQCRCVIAHRIDFIGQLAA